MASIVLKDSYNLETIDWNTYHLECAAHLAVYARPIFIRIQNYIQTTGTFKHQKNELVSDGFNPNNMKSDQIYFYHNNNVVPLTNEIYHQIQSGEIKL